MKNRLFILVGPPGTGKTTWCKQNINNAIYLSSDRLREILTGSEAIQDKNYIVFCMLRQFATLLLEQGKSVVIDATHINRKARKIWVKLAKQLNVPIEALVLNFSLKKCLERNSQRDRIVPDEVINEMFAKYAAPSIEEGFEAVRFFDENERFIL